MNHQLGKWLCRNCSLKLFTKPVPSLPFPFSCCLWRLWMKSEGFLDFWDTYMKPRGLEPERLQGEEEGKGNPEEDTTLLGVAGSGEGGSSEPGQMGMGDRSSGLGRQDTLRSLRALGKRRDDVQRKVNMSS